MRSRKFTAKEVCAEVEINITTLRHLTVGRKRGEGGKWNRPAILQKKKDFKMVLENGRAKYYYYQAAIDKIREYSK